MWLFDGSVDALPGGYDMGELSPNSPVKELQSFPGDLVLVGRATVLIKVRPSPSPSPPPPSPPHTRVPPGAPRPRSASPLAELVVRAFRILPSPARLRAGHRRAAWRALVARARMGADRAARACAQRAENRRAEPDALPNGAAHDETMGGGQGEPGFRPAAAAHPPTACRRCHSAPQAARLRLIRTQTDRDRHRLGHASGTLRL